MSSVMLLGLAFSESWFYFIDSPTDTPFAFVSRLPGAADETASADPKLEDSSYTDSQCLVIGHWHTRLPE